MRRLIWKVFVIPLGMAAAAGCKERFPNEFAPAPDPAASTVVVAPRTPHIKAYPCMEQCHAELTPNPEPRSLEEFHLGKQLEHGGLLIWCTWCHAVDDIDHLRLLDDARITFDEGHRLCGQCHGDKHRDWRTGIHGRRTGYWAGTKIQVSCPECHNPHKPAIPDLRALPAPLPLRGPGGYQHD